MTILRRIDLTHRSKMDSPVQSDTSTMILATMVVCALALRLAVAASSYPSIGSPSLDHGEFGAEAGWIARSLAMGQGFSSPFLPSTGPTALLPPLFPSLLALIFRVFGIYTARSALITLSLNSLFSALTCIPIYLSLKEAAGERQAKWAGWLWAIYPFSVYFSAAQIWDYALTALLFASAFCLVPRLHLQQRGWKWFGFGVLYGFAVLSNPSVLSCFPLLLLEPVWKVKRVGGPWLARGALTVIALAVVVGPWAIRNRIVMHSVSPIRDGFWLEFWAGNNGDTSMSNPRWAHPASNPVEMETFRHEGETAYLAHKRSLALSFVRHHPFFFAGVSLRRFVRFWTGFWSFQVDYLRVEPFDIPNVFFCASVTLLMLRGLHRWLKEDPSQAFRYLITFIVFPLPYYLTHSSMDYRQPIEPQIVIVVALGLFEMMDGKKSVDLETARDLRLLQSQPQMAFETP
jgi:4-amino-4-deoxy-L-arabinose transferase-like glycosyltransferase